MPPKEVFLSHSSLDGTVVNSLTETLRNHGVPIWYSATNLIGSQLWLDEIGRALKRCDWFMLLLSNNSVASEWVKRELSYALIHNQYQGKILPVIIEPCDYESLSWTLSAFQMVELLPDYEEGCRKILNTWGLGLDPSKLVT